MYLDHSGFGAGQYNFQIEYCDQCWIKGVESGFATGYHFIVCCGTLNFEFRDNFVHDGGVGPNNSGLNMYGSYTYGGDSSTKIENNIFNNNFPSIEINNSSSGMYIGYNFEYGTAPQGGYLVTWTLDNGHAPFNIMNLFEGNIGEMIGADGWFGGSGLTVFVRNYSRGYNLNGAAGDSIKLKRLNYQYSIIGNVLGSTAQTPASYQTGCDVPNIYQLGYPNIGKRMKESTNLMTSSNLVGCSTGNRGSTRKSGPRFSCGSPRCFARSRASRTSRSRARHSALSLPRAAVPPTRSCRSTQCPTWTSAKFPFGSASHL
jgi:hypothetical protein